MQDARSQLVPIGTDVAASFSGSEFSTKVRVSSLIIAY
jgi:hypothetical protein